MAEPNQPNTDETFDPTHRKLCPDGACVGVIGPDGICGECGRTEAQAAAGAEPPDSFGAIDDVASVAPGTGGAPSEGGAHAAGGFDPARKLCDDGTCVGVVGADGVCSVCGRRSE